MDVVLYSKEKDCAPCVQAKHFLAEHRIPYVEKDVANRDYLMELVKTHHLMTVPVLVVDEHKPLTGFNLEEYKNALGLA